MSVWSEVRATTTETRRSPSGGRAGRASIITIITATLMLLAGLVSPVGALAPDAPTVVSAIANGQDVTVTFTDNALNGSTVDDYEVTLTATSGGTTTDKTDVGSPITLNNVVPGTYDATVVINSDEGPSDPSAPVEVVVLAPAAAPAAPTAVSLTPSAGSVVVNFTAGNANGSTITDYTVTMTATANGANKTATVNASGGTVSGVVPGSYSVTVRANSAANGSSPVSAPATTTVPVGQPGLPTGSLVGTAIVASWPAAAAATGYNVELLSGANVVASTSVAGTSATFPNVDPGDYTVRVQATAGAVASAKRTSGEFNVTFRATAVANVSATVNSANTQVTVTWDPPADTGGGVAEYVVSLNPAEAPAQTVQAVNPRTVTFSGLPSGDYTVSVIAVNDGGDSDPGTDTFEIVVAPGAPLNVKTTKPSGVRVATVTWDPPANNGNGTISGYVIKMGGKTKTVGADVRTVSFADLPIGTLTATVQAQNAQGLSAAGSSPEFASERPVHPFESRQAFVQQAFRDLFDRSANAAEQTYWTNLTAPDGSNGANVVEAMMRSELFETRRQISRLYFAYFLRVPDAAGQNYWADLMDRGVIDLQGVSDEFARSAEFVQTYGSLDDAEFVVVVYNNVLLRTPDIVGFNYWLRERQAGLTRGGVMTWFTEGEEFKNLSLSAIDTSLAHITMLDRSPTTSEYRVWVNRINNNASDSLVTLLDAIWNSDEYAARVTPG